MQSAQGKKHVHVCTWEVYCTYTLSIQCTCAIYRCGQPGLVREQQPSKFPKLLFIHTTKLSDRYYAFLLNTVHVAPISRSLDSPQSLYIGHPKWKTNEHTYMHKKCRHQALLHVYYLQLQARMTRMQGKPQTLSHTQNEKQRCTILL